MRRHGFLGLLAACVVSVLACGIGTPATAGWLPAVAVAADHGAGDAGARPTVVFERRWEPRQKAFSVLVPRGWIVEGGMFHVDPGQAGGPGNSMEAKCDLTVKRDREGSVFLRWLPAYNYWDPSVGSGFAYQAPPTQPGATYQGMPVRTKPTVGEFLRGRFRDLHPRAMQTRVVRQDPLPELAEAYRRLLKPVNDTMAGVGLPPMTCDSGGVVFEYTEGKVRYREAILAVLVDNRAGAGSWSNAYTIAMRAPAGEADSWKAVLDVMRQSVEFNPEWVAAAARAAGERGRIVRDTMKQIQRMDQEIWESRQKTRGAIQHENELLLTDQEEYVNPFSRQVERDTSLYERRWTNAQGDRIYSDDPAYDPNQVKELNHTEWKLTPAHQR